MSESESNNQLRILRQVGVFQFKLLLDALRDVSLSPLSLLAALGDLLRLSPADDPYFDRVLALGRRSEHMIDLWRSDRRASRGEVDNMVDRLEVLLRDENARRQAPAKLRIWAETTLEQFKARAESADAEPPTLPPPPPTAKS